MSHKVIPIEDLSFNPFLKIGKEWMLITAGDLNSFNTMTASWGSFGVLWGKNIATCYIRPQRYTRKFIDSNEFFTLSFFSEHYREALEICGKYSGKDIDKVKLAGLTPIQSDKYRVVYFREGDLIFICRKIYYQDFNPENFLDETIQLNYPWKDYHRMFIGEIVEVLMKS